MNLAKSTRYALYAAVEMAAAGERPVTASEVAARYGIPPNALAKVFQQLVRAGVALGTRGVGGGYRLVRPADAVSVLDIVSVFEPPREVGVCALKPVASEDCLASTTCRLRRLFDEVDEMVRCTYASVSLETLVRTPIPRAARA